MLLDPLDQAADVMHKLWAIRAVRAANVCQTAPSPDALHGPILRTNRGQTICEDWWAILGLNQ